MDVEAGRRFSAFVRARWAEVNGKGGIRGLCRATGITPEVMYAWFRGDNEPSLGTLGQLADALKVQRSELVAVLDGYDLTAARRAQVAEEVEIALAPIRGLLRDAGLLPGATTPVGGTRGARSRSGQAA